MTDAAVWRGHALLGDELEERGVAITVEDGTIVAIEEIHRPPAVWICPCFFNAHTHLGDTIAMDIPASGTLAELVAPPDGLKHRLLRAASAPDLIAAMKQSIEYMQATGTAGFADFREGGIEGVEALRVAMEDLPGRGIIFGREGGETVADGIGISSAKPNTGIEEQVGRAREQGKMVAIHAGEKDSGDVDLALEYEPDLLVHCTHATDRQLHRIADLGIPIVICPRSNWMLGVARSPSFPPLLQMREKGINVHLGTDNVMFVQPDMFREMAFTKLIYGLNAREILKMAISGSHFGGRTFAIDEGREANFFVIDPMRTNVNFSHDHAETIVKRGEMGSIERRIISKAKK